MKTLLFILIIDGTPAAHREKRRPRALSGRTGIGRSRHVKPV
ncbi:hypothetical protein [Desulfococcus sp.]